LQATGIESKNRTSKTVGTPPKAGILAEVVKPTTACRVANYSGDTIQIRDDRRRRDSGHIINVNSSKNSQ
jgi:hypothetical protein